jgi:Domain of unknown function
MRESIASVLDASAALHDVTRLVYGAEEVSQAREADRDAAGLPVPDSIMAFNDELMAFRENINHFRSQLRRALLVVDQHDLVNNLRALGRVATAISLHAESIRDRVTAHETVDASSLDRDLGELLKTTGTLSDAVVARLKATG